MASKQKGTGSPPKGTGSPPKGTGSPPKGSGSPPKGAGSPPHKGAAAPPQKPKGDAKKHQKAPCPHLCTMVPVDVPPPHLTQHVLHPGKDVFVLKVAKVGPNGDRHCKMEVELVTPKTNDRLPPYRVDTKETQCEPCTCHCCCSKKG